MIYQRECSSNHLDCLSHIKIGSLYPAAPPAKGTGSFFYAKPGPKDVKYPNRSSM